MALEHNIDEMTLSNGYETSDPGAGLNRVESIVLTGFCVVADGVAAAAEKIRHTKTRVAKIGHEMLEVFGADH